MKCPITPLTAEQTKQQEGVASVNPWYIRILIGLDMFLNVIFRGNIGETISGRAGRACLQGKTWAYLLAAFLNIFRKNHCAVAVASDTEHARQVIARNNASGVIVNG